jgi:hypothetical protein
MESERSVSFRRLSFDFGVRCDAPEVAEYVLRVLGRFAVDEPVTNGVTYEVLDAGSTADESRYRLLRNGEWVLGSDDQAAVLDELFARVNVDTVKATNDLVLVHAGVVVTPAGIGVLLPASAGSGKTTLVAGLVRAGFGYLSDEAAVLDPETEMLHPFPVHLSLKAASRDRFPEASPDPGDLDLSRGIWHVDPDTIRSGAVASACRVGFVISHRYDQGAEPTIESITAADGCMTLATNLMLARRDAPRSLQLLAQISRASRRYRMVRDDLDAAVEAIVALTAA